MRNYINGLITTSIAVFQNRELLDKLIKNLQLKIKQE